MARRGSRKRRKQRRREVRQGTGAAAAEANGRPDAVAPGEPGPQAMARGYARQRAKDDAARAALEPLAPGERPRAVTVGAIVAAVAAVANAVALALGYEAGEGQKVATTVMGTVVLTIVAVGMWRSRYWAVLGMQTLLALTIIVAALALLTAVNVLAAVLVLAIIAAAGTLFWFLVKAMARIQMPERPGAHRSDAAR